MSEKWWLKKLSDGTVFDQREPFGYSVGFDLDMEAQRLLDICTDGDRHDFPLSMPCAVGVAHFAVDIVSRQRDEITQLRDRIAKLEAVVEAASVFLATTAGTMAASAAILGLRDALRAYDAAKEE